MEKSVEKKAENRNPAKLIILGGFLGAGKTTLMLKLAGILGGRGDKVGLITNDQGDQLVDSDFARAAGYEVGEVTGSCFCCNFPEFINNIESIISRVNPDYIIAEPVGSCTDLVSTIIAPLEKYHKRSIEINSFMVLADGLRLTGENGTLESEAPVLPGDILITHQLKEASLILINKCDLLSDTHRKEAVVKLSRLNPGARIIQISALDGIGMDDVMEIIDTASFDPGKLESIDLDYEIYARAEAEYGWYNGSWEFESEKPEDPMDIGAFIMQSFFGSSLNDVAHAKLHLITESGSMKISFVMGRINADESAAALSPAANISILLNIRATCSPEVIEKHVQEIFNGLDKEFKGRNLNYTFNSLVPGAPDPTYRL